MPGCLVGKNCFFFPKKLRYFTIESTLYRFNDENVFHRNVDIWNRNHRNTNKISVRDFYAKQAKQKEPLRVRADFYSFTS